MKNIENKWMRAAIPALLIHCSIGTVYCWSLVKGDIAEYIGRSKGEVEWAFSIAIFCLGMSAAFAGKIVERDVKRASLIAAMFFTVGMVGTGIAIYFKSLLGIYLCYGVIMGIGLGIGYLSPVKTLMLWFSKNKGLGTGLAVAGFGLSKVIASPVIIALVEAVGIYKMFFVLAAISFILMFIGHLLLKKPSDWVEVHGKSDFKSITLFKNRTFIGIWIVFYINVTCGLAIISQEKDLLAAMGISVTTIAVIASISAIFNAAGRLGFSALSDKVKERRTVYKIILGISLTACGMVAIFGGIDNKMVIIVLILIFIINAGYGGGFSCLPPILADCFGMGNISKIHGLTLSAWAFAGLTGNQISAFIVAKTGSYTNVIYVTLGLYFIALMISILFIKPSQVQKS